MGEIDIVSASAGSGKTYRLVEILELEVGEGRAQADRIVATTFTRDAAAELMTRVRGRLVGRDLLEEARLLEAARIGTVNSVCGRFVEAAAFELGLPPYLKTLDETVARTTFRRALSEVVTFELRAELEALRTRMVDFSWEDVIPQIVELARANDLNAEMLREQGMGCVEDFSRLFEPAGDHRVLLEKTLEALEAFVDEAPSREDTTKKTQDALRDARHALRSLRANRPLSWADWCKLSKLETGRKSSDLAAGIRRAAGDHGRSPALWKDAKEAIELCYRVAADALHHYQEHKRSWGAIDFTDQEVFALEALRREDVRARLQGTIDLVLVDEFQDTSPLQLAIFVELASIARRSVWVGDQKQAIYGFRGTDPELMDAAIDSILAEREPETLSRSWRSRAPLVHMTSTVFAAAFEPHGIPPARVRLDPAEARDPSSLGTAFEAWSLLSKNAEQDAGALAHCVAQLLTDESVMVREGNDGGLDADPQVRAVRPGDLAVLCRTHESCQAVAAALERLGFRTAVPRSGLFQTLEGRLCLAGLRLFCDSDDGLARAELVRLIYEGDDESWLDEVLRAERGRAFVDHPVVRRIVGLARESPEVGAVSALDLVLEAIEVDDVCRRWGDAPRRMANVDALRAHAVVLRNTAQATGTAATPAALVVGLEALIQAKEDACAVGADRDTITICTWHASKGREWPVTILTDLREFGPRSLGVRAFTPSRIFEFDRPLENRVIRYWPNPYHAQNNGMEFHERLARHPEHARTTRLQEAEDLRLLYVAWTRARDRLVLAGRPQLFRGGGILERIGPASLDLDAQLFRAAGQESSIVVREGKPQEAATAREHHPDQGPPRVASVSYPLARISPSDVTVEGVVTTTKTLGGRLFNAAGLDRAALGQAIHGFFAADQDGIDEVRRIQLATDLLERWEVPPSVPPVSLVEMSDRLNTWLRTRWVVLALHREVPLCHRRSDGTIVSGVADMLVETEEGWVVIDHKTREDELPSDLESYAAGAAGQLQAYADALNATGRRVVGLVVHFPTVGMVAEVSRARATC